jgi:hypothetical protein
MWVIAAYVELPHLGVETMYYYNLCEKNWVADINNASDFPSKNLTESVLELLIMAGQPYINKECFTHELVE